MKNARARKAKVVKKTAKVVKKGMAKSHSKTTKASKPAKAVKEKPAKESPKGKSTSEAAKKILAHPVEAFLAKWKPKNETFEAGVDRFLAELGLSEKERATTAPGLIEKLQTQFRKEPLTPAIEEQLAERFSKDRIHKLGTIFSMKPKTAIRLNYLKADLQAFPQTQVAQELKIKKSNLSPWGFEMGKGEEGRHHPILERGLFEFQDEASQIFSLFSNARPGHRVLDLCANHGVNALAIATMMRNKGSVFIYEADAKRLKVFRDRASKAGIDNYRIVTDSQIGEVKSLDVVVVEAPSSHIGELAHRPELKFKFQKEELTRLHKLQAALLREGARKLKLGGHLIYATTSLNKSENEAQIENFLRTSHNSYRLVPALSYLKEYIVPYVSNFFRFQWDEKLLQSFAEFDPYFVASPDLHGSQGMFIAILQRTRIST